MEFQTLVSIGLILIFVGIALIILTLLAFFFQAARKGKLKGGGAILIGPVPIVFGMDKESLKSVLRLSIVLMVLLIVFTLIILALTK